VLTILAVADRADSTERTASALPLSAAFFPLVGLVVGLALVATDLIFGRISLLARSALELVVAGFLTGGLHLDGLADTSDGLFSRADRQRALAIMRDSRLGALGVAALVSMLLLKLTLLASLSGAPRYLGLMVAPMTGRQAIVLAMAVFPPAQPGSGLGRAFARRLGSGPLIASVALWAALVAASVLAVVFFPGTLEARSPWPLSTAVVAAVLGALAVSPSWPRLTLSLRTHWGGVGPGWRPYQRASARPPKTSRAASRSSTISYVLDSE